MMYYDLFENRASVCREFGIDNFDGEIVYARYEYEDYSGSAVVVFVNDGKFYFVEGSHCSCWGLETQWSPEEMTVPMIRHLAGTESAYSFRSEACQMVLAAIEELNLSEMPDEHIAVALKLRFG